VKTSNLTIKKTFLYDWQSKVLEFPCTWRMRDMIVHALLLWGAHHVYLWVQQVWTGFGIPCHYRSVSIRHECQSFGTMSQFEQHVNIKFMSKLGRYASATLLALQQIYSNTAQRYPQYDCFFQFKNRQTMLQDDQRNGRPSTSITEGIIEKLR
jgi:hypothetical protein